VCSGSSTIELAKAAGFELVGQGDMLRNAADDHTKNVFDEVLRGKTDRFVLLLQKPGA
jgi:predicted methyltransferase